MYFVEWQPHSAWTSCSRGPQHSSVLHSAQVEGYVNKVKTPQKLKEPLRKNIWHRQISKTMEISVEIRVRNHKSHNNKETKQPISVHPLLAELWLSFPCCPPQPVVCFPYGWVIQHQWGWICHPPQPLLILVTRKVLLPAGAKYLDLTCWGEDFITWWKKRYGNYFWKHTKDRNVAAIFKNRVCISGLFSTLEEGHLYELECIHIWMQHSMCNCQNLENI